MSKNDTKTIGISATIAAIAAVMVFATLFTAATLVYAQTNSTGGNSTAAENSTAGGGAAKPASSSMQSPAASAANMSGPITIQKTGVSDTDPLPGHSAHQLVMAIPPRSDGKVWVGIVTWTASKPVEVVVLHGYNSSVTADAAHGQPLTAPFGKGSVAISLVKTPSGTPVASGSMPFVGNAIAFHTLNGDKFVVTYSADATAKDLTK
ncbi:MAG: hypothetical protein WBZ20_04480 [Nitrososphaeraceae archaeon]